MRAAPGPAPALARSTPAPYHLAVNALLERLSPAYWWSDPTTAWDGPAALAFAAILGAAFLVAVAGLLLAGDRSQEGPGARGGLERRFAVLLALASSGLLLLLFRWQMTPFFGRRLWFFAWGGAVVAAAACAALEVLAARRRRPARPRVSAGRRAR